MLLRRHHKARQGKQTTSEQTSPKKADAPKKGKAAK